MKRNIFGIFLLIVIVISVLLFGIAIFYKSDLDTRTKAGVPNFNGLPGTTCPTMFMQLQPDSSTPLSGSLTITAGQMFKAVVASSENSIQVSSASIQVQYPDGSVKPVGGNGAWETDTLTIAGDYIFVATIGNTCKTNFATLTVTGTNPNSSATSSAEISAPSVTDPTLPETTGATKTVCLAGCAYSNIQDAIRATPEKGTVFIKNGTYKNNLFFTDVKPEGAKEVTIQGESVDGVIIDGSTNVSNICDTLSFGKKGGIYFVENLTIQSSGGCAGISVGVSDNNASNDVQFTADNIKVIGSKGAGVYLKGAAVGKITNSTFTTSKYAGVSVHNNAKVIVKNSTFSSQVNQGVDLKDNAVGNFESNTFNGNGTSSIEQVLLMDNSQAGFKTNTFTNTKYTAYRLKNNSKLRSENDIFDGVTQSKKYIADSTAQITLITSDTSSSMSSSAPTSTLHPSCLAYDFNKDGKVDISDFAEWRPCYQKSGATAIAASGCGFADIVPDNSINITDFAYFVVAYTNYRTDPNKVCVK